MKLQKTLLAALGVEVILLLGGCMAEPTRTESNFGASVRQMIEAQTFDPSTRETPSTVPPQGGDGKRLESVLERYRTDVAKPEAAEKEVAINVNGDRR